MRALLSFGQVAIACASLCFALVGRTVCAQSNDRLEAKLLASAPDELYATALRVGNAARGAILFHGPMLGCAKCHSVNEIGLELLGPNLAMPKEVAGSIDTPGTATAGNLLVESILKPSAIIAEEYRAVNLLLESGKVLTGLIVEPREVAADAQPVVVRNLETLQDITVPRDEIAQMQISRLSVMPEGLTRALANEQEFFDLVKYLAEIRDGGPKRARELQPSAAQLAIQLPDYESHIDHAGMIRDWDDASLERGREIYMGLCVNCHGTRQQPGSLATALRFGEGKFKYGSDPYAMYQTLTRGAGLMVPQPWMVPQQKYDVIHYLREEFLKDRNASEYFELRDDYLAQLPQGDERGPAPSKIEPWSQSDYGPRLVNTYEIGRGGRNIAQKGIALQLDDSPGGIAHGRAWVVFDHDTMRVAGVWTSRGFIDWQGIHFNGRHGIHPHVVGDLMLDNPTGPGWANPESGSLEDTARVLGRDGKWYGPLPQDWARYEGIYQSGKRSIIQYEVGNSRILEAFSWDDLQSLKNTSESGLFGRHLNVDGRTRPLEVVVATLEDSDASWKIDGRWASAAENSKPSANEDLSAFDGQRYLQVEAVDELNMFDQDFTVVAKISVTGEGTIFSRAPRDGPWAPGGQSLFIRAGRLTYDVGWVGAVQSAKSVTDGLPHDIALTWRQETGLASLWIDGERVGKKKLRPKQRLEDAVMRIGRSSDNFPAPSTLNSGSIDQLSFFSRELTEDELARPFSAAGPQAAWTLKGATSEAPPKSDTGRFSTMVLQGAENRPGILIAGWNADSNADFQWAPRGNQLLLRIPAFDAAVDIDIWSARTADETQAQEIKQYVASKSAVGKSSLARDIDPQPPIYPETLVTEVELGGDQGGFAVDVLSIPTANPWQARVRTSGLDFFADGDRLAVCTWDGDVWVASGLSQLDQASTSPKLTWRRIAFGLFQPLGLKVINEQIYLTCRDQLVQLEDRNGDGEIDFYACINNDHQVTEHFHEFAMGLQTDAQGNFYYAKSARHALTALVPHHGTLLRVSPDGARTDILAKGFRAANGVVLNPDGTFIVTDQEGHWNPKNRINWVEEGGFYGNMYGYHDVTDESNEAMQQPLCWITNKFDRSPAELLWVDSLNWGPFTGSLLNLSYGYGKVFVVPHEEMKGMVQGGMCQLPIQDFPTGIMRGRFSPFDGQLYVCGLSAWATNQTAQEGGLYRIRYTGKPVALPVKLSASETGMRIGFSEPLGAGTSLAPDNYAVEVWSLKRTKNYGSDHFDQHALEIKEVKLSEDRQTLSLIIPDIAPTWSMEIRLMVETADGRKVERVIHNTIHNLSKDD